MENKIEEKIISVLSYFDIFDYPPTLLEIEKFLEIPIDDVKNLEEVIDSISLIQEYQGYYYFLGRKEIVKKRLERKEISQPRLIKARLVAAILRSIPSVMYVGLSGSLAMNNSDKNGDIDLFIVTRKNSVWLTRFLVTVALIGLRLKRSSNLRDHENKICPNFFVSENSLSFPKRRQSLYTAHEIIQMKTLYDKGEVWNMLLAQNKWIKNILPNAFFINVSKKEKVNEKRSNLNRLNTILFVLQKFYMRKKITNEEIKKDIARFHPRDFGKAIMDLYELKKSYYLGQYRSKMWIDKEEARFYFDEKKIRILN